MASKALPGNRCRSGGADSNLRPRLLKFPASDAERARKGQRAHPNPLSSFPPANWAPGEISKKSGHASMSVRASPPTEPLGMSITRNQPDEWLGPAENPNTNHCFLMAASASSRCVSESEYNEVVCSPGEEPYSPTKKRARHANDGFDRA